MAGATHTASGTPHYFIPQPSRFPVLVAGAMLLMIFGGAQWVNGAGWGKTQPFWEGTPEFWSKVIALNVVGPMQLVKALLPLMMERGSGLPSSFL